MNTLRTSAEDFGTLAENDSSTGYESNDHFTKEAYVEYTQESSGEQQFPDDFDYDDVTIGQTLMRAKDEPITLKKKACRPVCRRQSVMIERGKPVACRFRSSAVEFWNPSVCLQEFRENLVVWKSSWTQRLTRQFISWTIFRSHTQEKWGFG